MEQVGIRPPNPGEYQQAVLSSLLTTKYLTVIFLSFLLVLVLLQLIRFTKSILLKISIAFLIAVVIALFLYFRISSQIRF